jgi:hypothetical protein
MKTQSPDKPVVIALRRRIKRFYDHFNRGEFDKCYLMVDPVLREVPTSITEFQYTTNLERFHQESGEIVVRDIAPVQLHLDEPNRLYNNRDFALACLTCEDEKGRQHTFKERWVRDSRGRWYTRNTGFVSKDETAKH